MVSSADLRRFFPHFRAGLKVTTAVLFVGLVVGKAGSFISPKKYVHVPGWPPAQSSHVLLRHSEKSRILCRTALTSQITCLTSKSAPRARS